MKKGDFDKKLYNIWQKQTFGIIFAELRASCGFKAYMSKKNEIRKLCLANSTKKTIISTDYKKMSKAF